MEKSAFNDQLNYKNKPTLYSLFRIVGDNIDFEIHARVQDKEHGNRSVHWTHQFAVKDKVIDKKQLGASETSIISAKQLQLADLLPTLAVMERLKSRWAILVSRVLIKYVEKLKGMKSFTVKHIQHIYSAEMKEKSEVVSKECLLLV